MQAIVKPEAKPGIEVREVPVPVFGPDDVLVKVEAASVCGTDLHIYNWDQWAQGRIHPPLIPGHEFCGTVAAVGSEVTLTEIYLIGNTGALTHEQMQVLPGVQKVVRVSEAYRVLGRHKQGDDRPTSFEYQGVKFGQDTLNVFAGLCAVDSRESVDAMMKALQAHGQVCTRMGAYKPRTSAYSFQGRGKACLPYVFDLAGKYGIKVVAMEITHELHIDEIDGSCFVIRHGPYFPRRRRSPLTSFTTAR